jgi:putative MATE family efflux protein
MQKNDFSEGSVIINIIKLAVPMTLAQLVNVLYNVIDRIYIGHLGTQSANALTGLGVCLPFISVIIAFSNLIGMGGAALFSIERGKGNIDEAEKIQSNSFVLLILFSISLMFVGYVFRKPLVYMFGGSEVTYPFAESYISVYLCGTVAQMLSLGLNTFINAQGFGKTGMGTVAIGAVVNIVLDPLFIFVLDMGVVGAAFATIISQFVSAVWTIKFLTGKNAFIKIRKRSMLLSASRVKKIILLGTAGFTMSITNSIVQVVYNSNLQLYGGDVYVGVMTIINSVREVVQMPVSGISSSAQPVMGFNYGAMKYGRVKIAIKFMSFVLILYTSVMWLIMFLFPGFFIGLFSKDSNLLSVGIGVFHIYFIGFFMMAFQYCGQSVFTSLGFAKRAIFFSIFRKLILIVPLIYILPKIGFGTNGIFMAEPISNFVGASLCFVVMILTVYKKLNIKNTDIKNKQ